jgi:hypothetical protein
MYSQKRKYDEMREVNIRTQNTFLRDIKNCNNSDQLIYRIAIEHRSNFTREELLFIVQVIKKNSEPPPIEMSSYLI